MLHIKLLCLFYLVLIAVCLQEAHSFALVDLLKMTTAIPHQFTSYPQQCCASKDEKLERKFSLNPTSSTYNRRTKCDLNPTNKRRDFLKFLASSTILASKPSNAIPFFEPNHRQLELCLVTILRTQFWAMNIAKSLKSKLLTTSPSEDALEENVRKLPYLEARLGAKALLTQKIGGGSTTTVMKLASFNIKECLEDGKYWCNQLVKSNQIEKRTCTSDIVSISEDIVESLASIVEFDGLETTIDPSPRSSLMLSMYNPQKGTFVYRTLMERVIPNCERYLDLFGGKKQICLEFVKRDYSDEIPFEVLMELYDDGDKAV